MRTKRPLWQNHLVDLALLHRIAERGEQLPIVFDRGDMRAVFEDELVDLAGRGLIERGADGLHYAMSAKGREVLGKAVQVIDGLRQLEIFCAVVIDVPLEDLAQETNPAQVWDNVYDPRFLGPDDENPNAIDMRLAILAWQAAAQGKAIDPHEIVFMLNFGNGDFDLEGDAFWVALHGGDFFRRVEEIVGSAYDYHGIGENEDEVADRMTQLFAAGILEQKKRDGFQCSNCETPLALYEEEASRNGHQLTECPNPDCQRLLDPPHQSEFECPRCKAGIERGQRKCSGCGAFVDFSLPAGTVETETHRVAEDDDDGDGYYNWPLWGGGYQSYGYMPMGYYNPWGPGDVLMTALLIDAIF